MRNQSVLTKNVIVPAHKLHIFYEYVERQLEELEGKNFSSEIGYIYEIIELSSVENFRVVRNNFTGSIVYKATFTAEHCIPQVGEEIECSIIFNNGRLIIATTGPLKITILPEKNLPVLAKDDDVIIEILATEVNHGADFIKVVGKFVRTTE